MDHEHHEGHVQPLESPWEYIKFATVIIGITLVSVLVTKWQIWGWEYLLGNFMAVFFVVFAFFKLLSLETFAMTYSGYDIVAKRFRAWAYAFPFVELALGLGYLLAPNANGLNIITILVTGIASIGVVRELRRKSNFKCACLGSFIRLPLSKISFVEDFAMLLMALVMLFA